MKSINRISWLAVFFSVFVLWFVFGATTNINLTSPSGATNIVRGVLSESLINIGATNTNSAVFLYFLSGRTNLDSSHGIGALLFWAKDTNGTLKNMAQIVVSKTSGLTTNNASTLDFIVRQTNGIILPSSLTLRDDGSVLIAKFSLEGIRFTNGYLPFPQSTGTVGQVIKMGTNELYWATP